jgi:hypothetical protein
VDHGMNNNKVLIDQNDLTQFNRMNDYFFFVVKIPILSRKKRKKAYLIDKVIH